MVYIITGEEFGRETAQNGFCFLKVGLVAEPDLALDLTRTPISTQGEEEDGVIGARRRW